MKVILLQDVAKIGKRFSVVNVPDGYALNQLIPKRMAEPATPANLRQVERRKVTASASAEAGEEQFKEAVAALGEKTITHAAEANEQGHLFGAVREVDIAAAMQAEGIVVDVSMIKIADPIKALGGHIVQLVYAGKNESFTLEVVEK